MIHSFMDLEEEKGVLENRYKYGKQNCFLSVKNIMILTPNYDLGEITGSSWALLIRRNYTSYYDKTQYLEV